MPDDPWVIRSRRIVTPHGVRDGGVVVRGGTIEAIVGRDDAAGYARVEDWGDLAIMPGLVDVHVHVNEPGRTAWEGFETATRAAAAGGITTLVDMPLNSSPVTTSVTALREKLAAADGKLAVDVAFHGGLVPRNAAQIEPLIDAGVVGIKAFLVHSGIDEFPNATEADLRAAMPVLARRGVPLLVHAELDDTGGPKAGRSYASYLASRPRDWENRAVRLAIRLCREYGAPVHIVHLSSSDVLDEIRSAKADGLPLTVETCPHYLVFEAESIPDGDTRFKSAPPIREHENRERLWQGLADGTIDLIASDHSPCPPEMKQLESGEFGKAWGGISSLQLGLCAVWTEAARRDFPLARIARWMATAPAGLVRLANKGAIRPGADADLVVFAPEESWVVSGEQLFHRHKLTPHDNTEVAGRVRATYVRGQKVFESGRMVGPPSGRVILAGR
jgi:allantoinase